MPKFNVRRAVVSAGVAGALALGGTTFAFAEEAPVTTPGARVIETEAPVAPPQAADAAPKAAGATQAALATASEGSAAGPAIPTAASNESDAEPLVPTAPLDEPAIEATAPVAAPENAATSEPETKPTSQKPATTLETAPAPEASAASPVTPAGPTAAATPSATSEDDVQVATDPDRVQVVFWDYNGRVLSASDYLIGRPLKNWPVTPSRPGHLFLGFAVRGQEDQGVIDPETYLIPMGVGTLNLVAQYAELVTVTISDEDGTVLRRFENAWVGTPVPDWPDMPETLTRRFVGFFVSGQEDQGPVDTSTYLIPSGGANLVAKYKDVTVHQVTFHDYDGSDLGSRFYANDETLADRGYSDSMLKLVNVPVGGKLLGWAASPDAFDPLPLDSLIPPEITDLYPVVEEERTVTFHDADGSVIDSVPYTEGDRLDSNESFESLLWRVNVPEGGVLRGWATTRNAKEALAGDTRVPMSMTDLYPVILMPYAQYLVAFHDVDGTVIGDFLYKEGATFNADGTLDDMARLLRLNEGDTFLGWGTSANATETVSADALVTADVTDLYPVVKAAAQQFTVTFHDADGSVVGDVLYEEGDAINAANRADDMAKLLKLDEDEEFLGWATMLDATEALANDTVVTAEITDLYPVVQKKETTVEREYTVTFETGTDASIDPVKVKEGETVAEPEVTLEREGYAFAGWALDGERYDFSTPVTSDITLTAQWTKSEEPAPKPEPVVKYTVTFDANGGSPVDPQVIEKGATATRPEDPTREGYTFDGWYLGEELFDFDQPVDGDITLTATWVEAQTPSTPENPGTTTPDNPTKPGDDGTSDKPADKPADTPADKPADTPADKPADTPSDKPADKPVDKPADAPADTPAGTPADKPADKGDGKKDAAKKNELPKTGDETSVAGVAAAGVAGAAALGAGALLLNRRKRTQN